MKKQLDIKKLLLLNMPYILMGLFATNFGEAWRMAVGADASAKMLSFFSTLPVALASWWPSLHPLDLLVGLCCGAGLRLAVYLKSKNAKKYRHGMEYGSARWGTHEDIAPYIDPVFQNNVILTKTESLTMNSRPKDPKTARNKNVLVIGGSGSGKTRFWLKPNLMQMHSSYVVTDPKGTILVECGKMLQRGTPKLGKDGKPMKDKRGKVIYEPYRIKVLNTINFKKSMHYNPFSYIHSEKDILKLVTTLIANTKGEGKAGDDFWVKAETLLYCALIGYIHYEAPVEEQNFSTLIEFINAMEVREDDEEFKNPVDLMFDALEAEKPNHFAVRQYKKYKLAAGVASLSNYFTPEYTNAWPAMFIQSALVYAYYLLPFSMIVVCVMIAGRETGNNGILKMLALPVSRCALSISKFCVLTFYLFMEMVVFLVVFVIAGLIATQTMGVTETLPILYLLKWCLGLFLTMLPCIAAMWAITVLFEKPLLSVGLNLLLVIPGVLVANTPLWIAYPYCYSGYLVSCSLHDFTAETSDAAFSMFPFLPCAIVVFGLFFALAVTQFGKKEMR